MTATGLIVDNFAGGGGASTGIERALGRAIDVAINHDPEAVAMHAANHPATHHLCQNVWKADPREVVREASRRRGADADLPVELAWFSPDCKHFSKAKGSKPVEKGIRDLAWVVVHWARLVRPKVIMLENVEEFRDWGPLVETTDGRLVPCPVSKGLTFKRWCRELRKLGYAIEHRELRAADYDTPTIRKRLYVIARCDGRPIVWPPPSHAKAGGGGLPEWRWAAECIDFDLPCPSIFERRKALADNTLRRIARGVMRYVVNAERPFIVGVSASPRRGADCAPLVQPFVVGIDNKSNGARDAWPSSDPLRTMTRENRFALVAPHVTKLRANSVGHPVDTPMHTVTANGFVKRPGGSAPIGLVSAVLTPRYGERPGQAPRARPGGEPMASVVPGGNGAMMAGVMLASSGGPEYASKPAPVDRPVGTLLAENRRGVVAAFLAQHNTDMVGHDARSPVSTIVGKGCTQVLVAAALSHQYSSNTAGGDGDPRSPAKAVTAGGSHHALLGCELSDEDRAGAERVAAFLIKYYGQGVGQPLDEPAHAVTTKDRFGLVTVLGLPIVDIGMRMLTPRELFRAQGFPPEYVIDRGPDGKPLTKTAQTRMCGNSVCPPVAEALVRANLVDAAELGERAAD